MRHPDRGGSVPPPLARYLVLALLVLPAGPGTVAAQTTVNIDVFDFAFGNAMTGQPINPVIMVGDTVRWTFVNGLHTTTAAAGQAEFWDSGVVLPPNTYQHTFTQVGTFNYYCTLHGVELGGGQVAGMAGQVTVQPVPEPSTTLLAAALAGVGVWGYRRARRRPEQPTSGAVPGPSRTAGRVAVSLIELLTVVAVLGTLVGLLAPAVQKVRRSADYVTCRNNLKQIGLAIHNYEVSHGHYPGMGVAPHQDSVLARVLPFLELEGLHRQIAPDRPLFMPIGDYGRLDPSQAGPARAVVSRFLCPADGQPPVFTNYDFATLAGTSYVVNAGTGLETYYDFRYPTDGVFWYGSRVRHADVTKGLSTTMFLSEALLGTGADTYTLDTTDTRRQWLSAACLATPRSDRPGTSPPLSDHLCSGTMMNMPLMVWRGDRNASWIGGPGHRSVFNTYLLPNDRTPDCGASGLGRFKASSGHADGVNVILGDGSVHFIRNDIAVDVWRALSTRGEEVPGEYCGCH